MKRALFCSVLFLAMFSVMLGFMGTGVSADDGGILLVNPFNSEETRRIHDDGSSVIYRIVMNDDLDFAEKSYDGVSVSDLSDCVSSENTVLFVIRSFTMPESVSLNLKYDNTWVVGVDDNITVNLNTNSQFVVSSGSATISNLTIDGSGKKGESAGIRVDGNGSLTLKDTTVKNCAGGGVVSSGAVSVSGNVNITGNTAGGKASNLRSSSPITVSGNLTGEIGVDMTDNTTGIVAIGDILTSNPDSVKAFTPDNMTGYEAALNEKGQVIFKKTGSGGTDPGQDSDQKQSLPGITVDSQIDADNNKVTFTLTSNVPGCLGDYVPAGTVPDPQISTQSIPSAEKRGTYMLVFHNKLSDGLSINKDNLTLTVNSKTVDSSLYTVTYDTADSCTFELSVNLVDLYKNGIFTLEDVTNNPPEVIVRFDASPTDGKLGGPYTNTAYVKYGPDIDKLSKTTDASATVGLYSVTVFKFDQDTKKGLAGAVFSLSKDDKVILTDTTDENGNIFFTGLSAGNYILTETKAPEGYAQSTTPYKFTCGGNSDSGYSITVNFANVKLPHTGGIGYKLPVTLGIICLICGGVFIAVGKKKKKDE